MVKHHKQQGLAELLTRKRTFNILRMLSSWSQLDNCKNCKTLSSNQQCNYNNCIRSYENKCSKI